MKCSNCGSQLAEHQNFCVYCGAKAPTHIPPFLPPKEFPVPSGYHYDPESQLYYISESHQSPGGETIQRVTYFDSKTGLFHKVDYLSSSSKQTKQDLSQILSIIGLVLVGILFIVGIFFVGRSVIQKQRETPLPEVQEEWEPLPEVPQEEQKAITPIDPSDGIKSDSGIYDSSFLAATANRDGYYYFLSPTREKEETVVEGPEYGTEFPEIPPIPEDEDSFRSLSEEQPSTGFEEWGMPNPYEENPEDFENWEEDLPQDEGSEVEVRTSRGNAIYRMPLGATEAEPLVSVEEDTSIHDFVVLGDYLFYVTTGYKADNSFDYENASFYVVKLDARNTEPEIFYQGEANPMGRGDGYLTLLDGRNNELLRYGLDASGELEFNILPLNIGNSSLHMYDFRIVNGKALMIIYNYDIGAQQTIVYDLEEGTYKELFSGEQQQLYRNNYILEDRIYMVRFNGTHDGYQDVDLGYVLMESPEDFVVLSTKKKVQWSDSGPFLYVNGDTLYFEREGGIYKGDVSDPDSASYLGEISQEPTVLLGDLLIYETLDTLNLSTVEAGTVELSTEIPLIFGNPLPFDFTSFDEGVYFPKSDEIAHEMMLYGVAATEFTSMESYRKETRERVEYTLTSTNFYVATQGILNYPMVSEQLLSDNLELDTENYCRLYYSLTGEKLLPSTLEDMADSGELPCLYVEGDDIYFNDSSTLPAIERLQFDSTEAEGDFQTTSYHVFFVDGTTKTVVLTTKQHSNPVLSRYAFYHVWENKMPA